MIKNDSKYKCMDCEEVTSESDLIHEGLANLFEMIFCSSCRSFNVTPVDAEKVS